MDRRDRVDAEIELWLAAARRGEEPGFTGLYRALGGRVAGYLQARGVTDADDVTNQVFVGAFRNLVTYEGDAAGFRSWLFGIAWNKSCDWHRAGHKRVDAGLDEVEDLSGGDVESEALESLSDERVQELLEPLTADQRNVVLLRVVADLSLEETAAIVGKPVGAVKALQHRALASLKRKLGEPVSPGSNPTTTGTR